MKNVLKTRLIATAALLLSATITTTAFANDDDKDSVIVKFTFMGKLNNQPVFQLKLINVENARNYTVTIEDDNNYVLYKDVMKNGKNSVSFVLSEDVENVPLRFNIYDKINNKTFVYEVNKKTQVENKFLVTKL